MHANPGPARTSQQQSAPPGAAGPGAVEVLRYTAFSSDPAGGNGAGVVLDATGLDDDRMLALAAELGYSESAFLTPAPDDGADVTEPGRAYTLRFFSPKAEVSFCGHATVATAVALAEHGAGPGDFHFTTPAGPVPVTVTEVAGRLRATLTSVEPRVSPVAADDLAEALAALDWPAADLDPAFAPRIAYAGASHLVLAAATRERLADLHYDFARLETLMHRLGLTTVQLIWRAGPAEFHVRDPFPVGGVVEDPATGAAAAALGAYLRELGHTAAESELTLHQGEDMGRPGRLTVTLHAGDPRIRVSGTATALG